MSAPRAATPSASPTSAAIAALRTAAECGDADAVAEVLAADVVFHSPLTDGIEFRGSEEVANLHRDIFAVLDGLTTTEPLLAGHTGVFAFRARVRGLQLEATAWVRCNEQGQIADLTIFTRPLPALGTLFATLPPRVSTRRRGRLAGALVAALTRPLAFALRTADRLAPKFI